MRRSREREHGDRKVASANMVVAGAVVVAVGVVAAATAVEAATVVDAVANAVPLGANGRKLHTAFNSILHIICSVKIDSAERSESCWYR